MSSQLVPETTSTLKASALMSMAVLMMALTPTASVSMPVRALSIEASATPAKKKHKKKGEGETHKKAKLKSKSSESTPQGQLSCCPSLVTQWSTSTSDPDGFNLTQCSPLCSPSRATDVPVSSTLLGTGHIIPSYLCWTFSILIIGIESISPNLGAGVGALYNTTLQSFPPPMGCCPISVSLWCTPKPIPPAFCGFRHATGIRDPLPPTIPDLETIPTEQGPAPLSLN